MAKQDDLAAAIGVVTGMGFGAIMWSGIICALILVLA